MFYLAVSALSDSDVGIFETYEDRWPYEKDEFADTDSIGMCTWMKNLIKWNALETCEHDIDNQNCKVQDSANVHSNPKGFAWGEAQVKEEESRFDYPVN
jgi:hypothetical protein